jgi:hypothetical protein
MKNPNSSSRKPPAKHRFTLKPANGFALIVTLSLMILLTVVAVGLLALSSVSLRASGQTDGMNIARANAKLSLMMAINQIQTMTGPDQRVTITADQRKAGDDGKLSSSAPGNRHWSGVYRSWPATSKDRPEPEFISWMISGAPNDVSVQRTPETALTPADSVQIVGAGTLGENTAGQVQVPAVGVLQGGQKTARLAWWVGDQGMKAAISTPTPPNDNSFGAVRNVLHGAPRNAVEFATAGTNKPFKDLAVGDPRLSLVTTWQSAAFLASGVNTPRLLFHDLAPFSTGLLTNVTTGGFRKDLSMRLERLPTGTGVNAPPDPTSTALYTVANEPGINLNELWVYYNAYKDIQRSSSYNYTTSGQLARGTPHLLVSDSPNGTATNCANDFEFFLKQPTIISYQMILSLQAFTETVNNAQVTRVYLVSDPVVTLWNPLDIPVVIPQSAFISVKYWQIPYSVNVRVNNVPTISAPLAASLMGQTATGSEAEKDQNYLSIQLGTSQAEQIVLKPGEVVKFSQSGPVIKSTGFGGNRHTLIAKKGFNYGGGFAVPLKDLAGKTLDLKPTDQITYDALSNNITSGKTNLSGNTVTGRNAHSRHFSITHHEVYVGLDRGTAPNGTLGYGNMALDWDFGNRRLKQGEVRSSGQAGTKISGERLYANNFRNVFRPVSGLNTRPLSTAALLANKSPFMLLSYDAKTDQGSETATRSMTRFNPKAHHVDFYELTPDELDRMPYEFRAEPMVSWVNRSLDLSPDGSGFFGGGMNGQIGTNQVTTHSLPREPVVSLAAFQHSFANGFVHPRPTAGYATLNAREPMLPQVSHAIGNSLAPAMLAPDKTEGSLKGSRPLADHSYLANRALWDDYFLSGIAPQRIDTHGKTRDQKTVATEFFSKDPLLSKSLPVVRYKPDADGEDPSKLVSSFFSGNNPTDAAFLNLASYLRVDGLFNVNSTSVEAWKAMLGSLKGRPIIIRDANGKETIAPAGTNVPVTGLQNPQDLVADGAGNIDIRDSSQWVGRRELSETEIDQLAVALVAEIRKRGPFLSLADFVNRRVGSNKDLARAGALQSALDSNASGVNKAFGTVGAAASRFTFPEAEQGPTSFGIPGIIKQADILTPIAPVLSVRSDSFIVRGYGETLDRAGKVIARAWCEAVVERDRNFVDPADKAEALPASLKTTNQIFGRRYEIVSFRWLSPSEV